MHFNNESDLNSNTRTTGGAVTATEATTGAPATVGGAAGSCASSTDSGVVIIDNKTTFASSNNFNNKNTNNNFIEKIKNNNNNNKNTNNNNRSNPKDKRNENTFKTNDEKLKNINRSDRSQPAVNVENFLMIREGGKTVDQDAAGDERKRTESSGQRRCSPTVSIRSTSSISIVSIDENALDSSVVDSDSDCEADAEGVHSTYVVKKLGQQTTYAPDSPDLPAINKGLTVISQKISPGSINGCPAGPGALAEQLLSAGAGGSCLAPPGQAQIGSIALTNSTDVTFGDKHFYEGPVTIQQFLIDSRDKAKSYDSDGNENPTYVVEHGANKGCSYDGASGRPPPTQPESQPYKFIFNRKAVIITSTIIVLTMLAGILILTASNLFKTSIRKNLDDDDDYVNGTLNVVRRDEWSARTPQGELDELKLPVHRVIISHTASDTCDRKDICAYRLQVIQAFHMDSMGWNDIGYNFLIGSDGRVYVGRGWDTMGAHTKGYNTDSVGISLIGTFTTVQPPPRQLLAAQLLIEEGVRRLKLAPNYRIYGARQLGATESPGSALYALIQKWPHWSQKIG